MTCRCGKPVPAPRRRHCSDRCAHRASRSTWSKRNVAKRREQKRRWKERHRRSPPSPLVVECVLRATGLLTQRTLYEIADYVRNDYGSIGTQTVERALLSLVDRGLVEEHPAEFRDWKTYTRRRK